MKTLIESLQPGTMVVILKTSIKNGFSSPFKPREKKSGTLSITAKIGTFFQFDEAGGQNATGEILSFFQQEEQNHFTFEDETSYYSLRVVKNKDDVEFKQSLGH